MPTPNLNLTLPTEGGSEDVWGDLLNDALEGIDDVFAADGSGTSVGVHVGTGKTLDIEDGTLLLPKGTFTPALAYQTNPGTVNVDYAVGTYTEYSNRVAGDITIKLLSQGGVLGPVFITGLPVPAVNLANYSSGGSCYITGVTSAVQYPEWYISANSSQIILQHLVAGSAAPITNVETTGLMTIILHFDYQTA